MDLDKRWFQQECRLLQRLDVSEALNLKKIGGYFTRQILRFLFMDSIEYQCRQVEFTAELRNETRHNVGLERRHCKFLHKHGLSFDGHFSY